MQEKKYDWSPQFRTSSNEPYDLSLFKNTISASYSNSNYVEISSFRTDSSFIAEQNAVIVYIEVNLTLEFWNLDNLFESVNNGNQVFISTHTPNLFIDRIDARCRNELEVNYINAKNIYPSIKTGKAKPKINFQIREDIERAPWYYFNSNNCGAFSANVLGTFETQSGNYINFLELPYGKGSFYIHLTPLMFTNFHFRNEEVFAYTNELFQTIPHEKLFYYIPKTAPPPVQDSERPYVSERNFLQFILKNPPLKWAWYIILLLSVVYVINSMRRNQRAIPIIELPQNETSNYLDVVSRLYQKEGRHKHIIQVQEKLIFDHLRQKYRINLTNATEETYRAAAQKLQMNEVYLKNFFHNLNREKHNSNLSNGEFIEAIKRINEFYSKCP